MPLLTLSFREVSPAAQLLFFALFFKEGFVNGQSDGTGPGLEFPGLEIHNLQEISGRFDLPTSNDVLGVARADAAAKGAQEKSFIGGNSVSLGPEDPFPPTHVSPVREGGGGAPQPGDHPRKNFLGKVTLGKILEKTTPQTTPETTPELVFGRASAASVQKVILAERSDSRTDVSFPRHRGDPPLRNFFGKSYLWKVFRKKHP